MPEHELAYRKKQKVDRSHIASAQNAGPLSQNLTMWDTSPYLTGETHFNLFQTHADLLSKAPSDELRAMIARQLQQTYGNHYIQRLVDRIELQAKLTVGEVDDPLEQEADRVAEQVVNMPFPADTQITSQRQAGEEGEAEESGTLPDKEGEEEVVMGSGVNHLINRDAVSPDTSTASTPATPPARLKISTVNVGIDFDNSATRSIGSYGRQEANEIRMDALTPVTVSVDWDNPGGETVDPAHLGQAFFRPMFKNITYTITSDTSDVKLDFTLYAHCPWGTNGAGKIDVPSATDPVVTIDKYKKMVWDLTPVKMEKCWAAHQWEYWSQALMERHEIFHTTDKKKWVEGPGKKTVIDYLKGKALDPDNVLGSASTLLDNARAELVSAASEYYTGGATSYWSYAGEERAYGDGKRPFEELARAVKDQGEKLEAEEKKLLPPIF